MAFPVIVYNATTGDDQHSGAGPSTVVSGTDGSIEAADVGGQLITLNETVDFTGAGNDESDIIYFEAASAERRQYRVDVFGGGISTCTSIETSLDSPVGSEQASIQWAVGGKRKTLEGNSTQKDYEDDAPGWTREFEDGTYTITESLAPAAGNTTSGPMTYVSGSGHTPVFDVTTNIRHFRCTNACNLVIDGITFTKSVGGSQNTTAALRAENAAAYILFKNCIVAEANMDFGIYGFVAYRLIIQNCNISLTDKGVEIGTTSKGRYTIENSAIHDCVSHGIHVSNIPVRSGVDIRRNTIYDNGGDGCLYVENIIADGQFDFCHNTVDRNTSDGLFVTHGTPATNWAMTLNGNSFTDNGAYGVSMNFATGVRTVSNQYNNYFGNTSGDRQNLPVGFGDISHDATGIFTSLTDGSEDYTPLADSPIIGVGPPVQTA